MSREETYGFKYPPGLASQRSRELNDQLEQGQAAYYGTNTVFSTGDRRISHEISGYPSYARDYGEIGPNRHNFTNNAQQFNSSSSSFNHHHPASPPLPAAEHIFRASPATVPATSPFNATLYWADLEPWMDEEYVKQVCAALRWEPVAINVPRPAPDPVTGQQANNPGFCFLTFPTAAQAASVLAQINGTGNQPIMPNSSRPFVLNWAPAAPGISPQSTAFGNEAGSITNASQQYPKEYSIFVGDLAPETSNSDLVAVFRNPLLGLRNDREPKFIRPFQSCKSAKIMIDPVTGVSRGYGFVRFTDEADQQRALIEMHGLYCQSRPMRISPATAKYKAAAGPTFDMPQIQFLSQINGEIGANTQPVAVALPLPNSDLTKSVSVPIATTGPIPSNNGVSASASSASIGTSSSTALLSSGSSNNVPSSVTESFVQDSAPPRHASGQSESGAPRFNISEESWRHHAQARAILGNLIGPNGEQLTSTDPYNTTVFVGGLSDLIKEDTLLSFFKPFGDIHYVKVPVGKHCGFVQYVRKADAEKAIEKMQGFPISGQRIRLSWGRSQYKAAQAAAQAAQAAALQSQFSAPPAPNSITPEQAIQLLQKLHMQGYLPSALTEHGHNAITSAYSIDPPLTDAKIQESVLSRDSLHLFDSFSSNGYQARPELHRSQSSFAPFSPDPNAFTTEAKHRGSFSHTDLPHPSKAYAPGFYPQELKVNTDVAASGRTSPSSGRLSSTTRYNTFSESLNATGMIKPPGRPEATISRPTSGPTQTRPTSGAAKPEHKELDPLRDLNSTLASLELDRPGPAALQLRTPSPSN
ncbi:hypothetical protein C0995_009138 [Termitomyces sp. Mi166|nr:hypothetical protein C0995_009138 [Termitomyces sp. Mi166\